MREILNHAAKFSRDKDCLFLIIYGIVIKILTQRKAFPPLALRASYLVGTLVPWGWRRNSGKV
jgi:hypothetical protein